jgi:PEP-CTERM motif
MCKDGGRKFSFLRSGSTGWLVLGVLVTVLAAGQAYATVISNSFIGFPPDPFTQQDKTWGGWTDVSGNLPAGFTTLITTRSQIVPGKDIQTGAGSDISGFSNSFLENISVPEPGALALFGTGVLGLAALLRRRLSN